LGWDREVPGEDDRAQKCYQELLDELGRRGYYSYRLSVAGMNAAGGDGSYGSVLSDLKRTLDPNGILAPGRYVAA
jgi:4-cresol dehydrogenase (hydroxylating)